MDTKRERKGRVAIVEENGWVQHYCWLCDREITDRRYQKYTPEDDVFLWCDPCDLADREMKKIAKWRLD